jgi:hypothetical protein
VQRKQKSVGIPSNRLRPHIFLAAAGVMAVARAQRNTPTPPGLDIDGMSNRKKRKFSFETL